MERNSRKMSVNSSGDKDVRSMFISYNGDGYASSESLSDSTECSSDGYVIDYSYSEFSDSETSDDNCSKSHFDKWSRRRRDSHLNKGGYLSKLSHIERKHKSEFAGNKCGSARSDDTFESEHIQHRNPSESNDNGSEVGQDKYSVHSNRIDSVDESIEARRNMFSLLDEIRENKRRTSVNQDKSENICRSENTRNFRDQWKGTESSHSQYQKVGKTYEGTNLGGAHNKEDLDPILKEKKKLQSSSSSATTNSNNWHHTKAKGHSDSSRSQAKRKIPILRNKTSGDDQDLRNIGKKSNHDSYETPSSRRKSQSQNTGRQRLPKHSISPPKEVQSKEEKRERQSKNKNNLGSYVEHHSTEMQSTKPPSRKVKKPKAVEKLESEEYSILPITDMRERDSSIQEKLQCTPIHLTKKTQSIPKQNVNVSIKEKTQTFQTSDQNKQDSEAQSEASEASDAPFQDKSQTSNSINNKTNSQTKFHVNNSLQGRSLASDEKKSDLRDKSDFSFLEKSQMSSSSSKKKPQRNKSKISHNIKEKSRTSQARNKKKPDTKKGYEGKRCSSMEMSLTSNASDKKKLSSKERDEQKSSNTDVHYKEISIMMQTTGEKKKIEPRHSPEKEPQNLDPSSTTHPFSDNSEAEFFAGKANPKKKSSIRMREKSTSNFCCIQRQPKVVASPSKSSSCRSQESRNDGNRLRTNKVNKSSLFNNKQSNIAYPSLKKYASEVQNLSESPIASSESNEYADVTVVLQKDKKSTADGKLVSSFFNNSSQALMPTEITSYDSTPDLLSKTLDAAEEAIELQFQRRSPKKKKMIKNIKRIFPSVRKRPKDEHKHDFGLVTIIVESRRT